MSDYFTKETDEAIKEFIETDQIEKKHAIFDKRIRPAFEKLIESQIYVYFVYNPFLVDNIETLKKECLSMLYEMIPKYDPYRGKKGFSYFNVISKNWFIHKIRERNRSVKMEKDIFYDLDGAAAREETSFSVSPFEDQITEKEFWTSLFENMDQWRGEMTKKSEKQVLEAIIFLMRNSHLPSIYNKKAIYLYLRELTGLNTKQVIVNLKKIRCLYENFKKRYDEEGY